jgi:hypothetical protein
LVEDLGNALALIETDKNSRLVLLASPSAVQQIALQHGTAGPAFPNLNVDGGSISGIQVLATDALSDAAILLDGRSFGADLGLVTMSSSTQASVELSDGPTSEPTQQTSFYQNNLVGLRVERLAGMSLVRPTGVCIIDNFAVTA